MRYHLLCHECLKSKKGHGQFTIEVSPNNEGIYDVKCPKEHQFSIDILSHHFQVLFENGLHALSDNYFVESFVSFVACYERFIEYFLRIVLISNGAEKIEFENTWKELAKQSERQIGAFFMVYLQEFKHKPIQLSNKNRELRNNVIHKGHLPTEEDCIKFGNNVLDFIRPIIEFLKAEKKFNNEMISSVSSTGNFENTELVVHYMPYQIFAINRPINQTENKSITDFLEDQNKIKKRA